MHKTVSLIVSLLSNPAVNSLCYTYIQIYVWVALTLALIFITVPNPKTRRGQTVLLPMIVDPGQLQNDIFDLDGSDTTNVGMYKKTISDDSEYNQSECTAYKLQSSPTD